MVEPPPPYGELTAGGVELAQVVPETDARVTVCICCGAAVKVCGCTDKDRVRWYAQHPELWKPDQGGSP